MSLICDVEKAMPPQSVVEQYVVSFELYRGRLMWSGFWWNSQRSEVYGSVLLIDGFRTWTSERFILPESKLRNEQNLKRPERLWSYLGFEIARAVRAINFSYRAYRESDLWC